MIHYNDMLLILDRQDSFDKPLPFSISYVKADENRNTGGEEVSYIEAFKSQGVQKKESISIGSSQTKTIKKNPHHFDWGTINIVIMPSKQIKKVHTALITKINGEEVYW